MALAAADARTASRSARRDVRSVAASIGIAAGAEALGEINFQDDAGSFWGLLETRPYMRARHELALAF